MVSVRKIIHVTDDFTRSGGGVATAIAELARGLNAKAIPSEIVATRVDDTIAPKGVPVLELSATFPWIKNGVAEHLQARGSRGAIIHVHGLWKPLQLQAARTARKLGIPWVFTPHNMLGGWLFQRSRWKWLKKQAYLRGLGQPLLRPDSVHFLSVRELAQAQDFFPGATHKCVLPNGLYLAPSLDEELQEDETTRQTLQGTVGKLPYFLYLGRLHEGKGIEELIHAFAGSSSLSYRLVLAGTASQPSYGKRVRELVASLGLDERVVFAGRVHDALKGPLLRNAQATCLISYSEGMSLSALESLKFGTPLVATQEVGISKLNQHGSLIVSREVNDVRKALELASLWSAEERARRGEASRRYCETQFSWSVLGQQYVDWYDHTLKRTQN